MSLLRRYQKIGVRKMIKGGGFENWLRKGPRKGFRRKTLAWIQLNQKSLKMGRGFRWGRIGTKTGLGAGRPRIEGWYIQERIQGRTLINLRNKQGQNIFRLEKGPAYVGGKSFWHYHRRPGFKHHRTIFPWQKKYLRPPQHSFFLP